MTFREKYEKEYSDKITMNNEKFPWYGCPSQYYNDPDSADCKCPPCCLVDSGENKSCAKCWEREMPEEANFGKIAKALKKAGTVAEETMEHLDKATTEIPRILDSGNRREFETGAVRDICEGKGRCDLLPLDVVGHALCNPTLAYIAQYMREDGDYERLYDALSSCGIFHDYWTLFLEVAKHFEEGCKKYGDNNWQKGIPTHCYIDSAVRHYLKYLRGDKDEPHDRAFCWNILCCIWTCIHKPELNDYAPKEENEQ